MNEPTKTYCISEIELASGRRFNLLNPVAYTGIEHDIAHALGNLCRYTGHCSTFYSVAQHSVRVADRFNGSKRLALAGLLHDAHEGFTGDMSLPLKRALALVGALDAYREICRRIQAEICAHFGLHLTRQEEAEIKHADTRELMYEAFHLMTSQGDGWDFPPCMDPQPLNAVSPTDGAKMFLERFERYSNQ